MYIVATVALASPQDGVKQIEIAIAFTTSCRGSCRRASWGGKEKEKEKEIRVFVGDYVRTLSITCPASNATNVLRKLTKTSHVMYICIS